jgi:hypothetical protein
VASTPEKSNRRWFYRYVVPKGEYFCTRETVGLTFDTDPSTTTQTPCSSNATRKRFLALSNLDMRYHTLNYGT